MRKGYEKRAHLQSLGMKGILCLTDGHIYSVQGYINKTDFTHEVLDYLYKGNGVTAKISLLFKLHYFQSCWMLGVCREVILKEAIGSKR